MACCLFNAKLLHKPMLPYCQLDNKEQMSLKFHLKFKSFQKIHLKMLSVKGWPFCLTLNVLKDLREMSNQQNSIIVV